jgi:hypothetical protein
MTSKVRKDLASLIHQMGTEMASHLYTNKWPFPLYQGEEPEEKETGCVLIMRQGEGKA